MYILALFYTNAAAASRHPGQVSQLDLCMCMVSVHIYITYYCYIYYLFTVHHIDTSFGLTHSLSPGTIVAQHAIYMQQAPYTGSHYIQSGRADSRNETKQSGKKEKGQGKGEFMDK